MLQMPKNIYHKNKQIELYCKQDAIQEIIIDSITNLKEFYNIEELYSFRGQSNSSWNLTTTLERSLIQDINLTSQEEKITQIYMKGMDKKSIKLDDIANIQHYGWPTRLLDWTKSFDTALFFAVTNGLYYDGSVFCLRNIVLSHQTISMENILQSYGIINKKPWIDKNKLLSPFVHQIVKNKRIAAQKGYFIYPKSVENTFEESLSYTFDNLSIEYKASSI